MACPAHTRGCTQGMRRSVRRCAFGPGMMHGAQSECVDLPCITCIQPAMVHAAQSDSAGRVAAKPNTAGRGSRLHLARLSHMRLCVTAPGSARLAPHAARRASIAARTAPAQRGRAGPRPGRDFPRQPDRGSVPHICSGRSTSSDASCEPWGKLSRLRPGTLCR